MQTKDGIEVTWKHSRATLTTLTLLELKSLQEGDSASKCVAHARLTESQFSNLFRRRIPGESQRIPDKRRAIGRHILHFDVYNFCRGIGENRLEKILGRAKRLKHTRDDVIKELLKWS